MNFFKKISSGVAFKKPTHANYIFAKMKKKLVKKHQK